MDDIHITPGWGIPDDFNDMSYNRNGNQRTSYDEMQDVLDDLADDMSIAVTENKWMELLIYPIEAMERKAKDLEEFDSMVYGLFEYLSMRFE